MCEVNDDKPFVCSALGCAMRFTNEDHLNVHMKKHEMSLALNPGGHNSSQGLNLLDQTPTPTKFLKNCEEIGLFQELSKNPFEEAFKKASDVDGGPLPGPQSNELNTPIPPPLMDKPSVSFLLHDDKLQSPTSSSASLQQSIVLPGEALDLTGHKLQERVAMLPSSTTTDDEEEEMSVIGMADSTQSPSKTVPTTIPILSSKDVSSTMTVGVNRGKVVLASQPMAPQTLVLQQQVFGNNAAPPQQSVTSTVQPGQSCTMQVYLQLPSGQTVPVHIPATINTVLSGISTETSQQALHQLGTTTMATSSQRPKLATRQITTPTAVNSSMALKQKLKQTLQAQQQQQQQQQLQQQVVVSSSVKMEPAGVASAQSPLMMTLDSPSIESIVAELEPISKRPKSSPSISDSDDPDERRRKFLERNRAAAARCRQKRKHWISNLERKAEELQQTNNKLQGEVSVLRGEVAQLKTLLLAHQDCPITLQQKSQGQLALHTISMVESASVLPFDLTHLVNSGTVTLNEQQITAIPVVTDSGVYTITSASDTVAK